MKIRRNIQELIKNHKRILENKYVNWGLKLLISSFLMMGSTIFFIKLFAPEFGFVDIKGENLQEMQGSVYVAKAKGEANEIRISPTFYVHVLVEGYEVIDSNNNIKFSNTDYKGIIKIESDHQMRIRNLNKKLLQYDFYVEDISGMDFYYRDELVMDDWMSLDSSKGHLSIIGKEEDSNNNWELSFFPNGKTIKFDNKELEKNDVIKAYNVNGMQVSYCNGIEVYNGTKGYVCDWELFNLEKCSIYTEGTMHLNLGMNETNYYLDGREVILKYDDGDKYSIGDEDSLRAHMMCDYDDNLFLSVNGPVDSTKLSGLELFPNTLQLFLDSNIPALIFASFIGAIIGKIIEYIFDKNKVKG